MHTTTHTSNVPPHAARDAVLKHARLGLHWHKFTTQDHLGNITVWSTNKRPHGPALFLAYA